MQPLRRLLQPGRSARAVANQNADVIKIASAERIPIKAADTGSDHNRHVAAGSGSWSPRSKAAIESKSRVRANLMSRSSAARTSPVNGAHAALFPGPVWGDLGPSPESFSDVADLVRRHTRRRQAAPPVNLGLGKSTTSVITRHPRAIACAGPNNQISFLPEIALQHTRY